MSAKKDYTFSVETIRAGQPRPYADSKSVLYMRPPFTNATERRLEIVKGRPGQLFNGYYTFQKIDENTYKYYVFKPFCD